VIIRASRHVRLSSENPIVDPISDDTPPADLTPIPTPAETDTATPPASGAESIMLKSRSGREIRKPARYRDNS